MKKIAFLVVTALYMLVLCLPAQADVRSDRYQPDADALKKQLFTKKGKHELSPTFGLSTNDAFYQVYYFGIMYNYHIRDWVSIGALLNGAFSQPTGLTKTLSNPPNPTQPGQSAGFGVTPDVRQPFFLSTVGVQARFAPFYGKLSFFSEAVVHFDFYFTVGGGLFLTHAPNVTRNSSAPVPPGVDANTVPGSAGGDGMGFLPYGQVGVGQRYFLLRWLALRWEFDLMMMPESFTLRGGDTRLRLNMQFSIGFSFFL